MLVPTGISPIDKPAEKIDLQRVHRLGKPVAGKIRPIIARFLRYPDREKVLRASFGLNRATEIKVLEDFPKEIIERRRKQMPKLKEAKKKRLKVAISKAEPDKLFINGKIAPMQILLLVSFRRSLFFNALRNVFLYALKQFTPSRLCTLLFKGKWGR